MRSWALIVFTCLAGSTPARAESGWELKGQLGLGAMAGNNVFPIPLAPAGALVAERGLLGAEIGFQANAATYCDHLGGAEGSCGWLLIAEAGPRLRLASGPWSVYLAVKAQALRMTESPQWHPGVAPRLGMTYQAHRVGLFAEVGPTFVLDDDRDSYVRGLADRRTLPALDLGLRF
jgi:hypothetical protein